MTEQKPTPQPKKGEDQRESMDQMYRPGSLGPGEKGPDDMPEEEERAEGDPPKHRPPPPNR